MTPFLTFLLIFFGVVALAVIAAIACYLRLVYRCISGDKANDSEHSDL